jgi:hypothetical protein
MTTLRYTAEQINLLEAQYEVENLVYALSRRGNEWAQTVRQGLPFRLGDKWNSMANNVMEWAKEADKSDVETLVSQLDTASSRYVKERLKYILKYGKLPF